MITDEQRNEDSLTRLWRTVLPAKSNKQFADLMAVTEYRAVQRMDTVTAEILREARQRLLTRDDKAGRLLPSTQTE